MEDNFVSTVLDFYKEKKWRDIVEKFHDYPERSQLLWVFPSEENLIFLKSCLFELNCNSILSIGCGSGLLEWIITEATGIPVRGVEVDCAWWNCKYAPPTFIPLLITNPKLDKDIRTLLVSSNNTALLFCYFNNRSAFEGYLKFYSGRVIVIIGPGEGKGIHTDPLPFGDVDESNWLLYKWTEIRNSSDFIAIYIKKGK